MTTANTFTLKLVLEGLARYKSDVQLVMGLNKELSSASKSMSRDVAGAFTSLAATSTAALTSMVAVGATAAAALIGVGVAATKLGATYEQGLVKVGSITQTATKDLGQLDQAIKTTASYSNTAIEVINEAASSLAQGNVSVQDISNTVLRYTDYLYRASAGELDMAKAAQLIAGAMSTFNIKGEQVFRIVNSIAAAATKSAVTFTDIDRSFRQAITVTGLLGYTVEETAALVGTLGRNFLRGSDAGTSFKQMLLQLVKPSKQTLDLMQQYQISLFNANGTAKDAREVVAELQREFGKEAIATGKITEAERERALAIIFGSDAIRAAISLAEQGTAVYDDMYEATHKVSAMQMAQAQSQDVLIPQLAILKNNLKIAAIEMTSNVVPAITGVVKSLTGLVRLVQKSALPKLIGDMFKSMVSGKGFEQIKLDAVFAFGPATETMLVGFVNMIQAVRDAVTNDLIPAFNLLFLAITGGGLSGVGNIFNSIAAAIKAVSSTISLVVVNFARLITYIKQSQTAMAIFNTLLSGIKAAPILLIAAIFAPLVLTIGKMALAAYALGAALEWIAANPAQAVQVAKVALIVLGTVITAWTIPTIVNLIGQFKFLLALMSGPVVAGISGVAKALTALGLAIMSTIRSLVLSALGFVRWAAQAVASAAIATIAFSRAAITVAWSVSTTLAQAVLRSIALITLWGITVAARGTQAAAIWTIAMTKITIATLWASRAVFASTVGTMLKGMQTAAVGIVAAGAPVIIAVLAIAATIAAVAVAWATNWNNIQGITAKVINIIIDNIQRFLSWLKGLPFVGEYFTRFGDMLGGIGEKVGEWAGVAGEGIAGVGAALVGATDASAELKAMLAEVEQQERYVNIQAQIAENSMKNQLALQEAMNKAKAEGDAALSGQEEGGNWFPPGKADDGGTEKAKEDIKTITDLVWSLIRDLPAVTREVAGYLAEIVKDYPERLLPMVETLRSSKTLLGQMVVAKYDLLVATQAVEESERRSAEYSAKIGRLDLQMKVISLAYEGQLLAIKHQINAIDQQMYPLKDRIAAIDREITALSKENLQYVLERAQLELNMLPQTLRIAEIDKAIKEAGREDYANTVKQLELQLAMLPIKNQMYEIDRKISLIEDKRLTLNTRLAELLGQKQVSGIEFDLKTTESKLEKAWASMDVKTILALEVKAEALREQLDPAKAQLEAIQHDQEVTQRDNEIISVGLELEKLGLEELLNPMQHKLDLLKQEEELRKLTNDLIIANLNLEKAKIEESIKAQTDRIFAIEQLALADKIRNAVAIANLEIEKAGIEALLLPLELQRQALERIQTQLGLNLADAIYAFEVEKNQYELLMAEEDLRRLDLEATRLKQAGVFDELTLAFVEAMVNSGSFTFAEAIEVATRMKMWSNEAAALAEVRAEFSRIKQEAWAVKSAIDDIPKDVWITITTVHKDIYENVSATGRQVGGPVFSSRLYRVGEAGPELFVPSTNGSIIPNNMLKKLASISELSRDIPNNMPNNLIPINESSMNTPNNVIKNFASAIKDFVSINESSSNTPSNMIKNFASNNAVVANTPRYMSISREPSNNAVVTNTPKDMLKNFVSVLKNLASNNAVVANTPKDMLKNFAYASKAIADTPRYMSTSREPSNMTRMITNSYDRSTTAATTYNINANYAQSQSPVTLGMDLRAISAMTRR